MYIIITSVSWDMNVSRLNDKDLNMSWFTWNYSVVYVNDVLWFWERSDAGLLCHFIFRWVLLFVSLWGDADRREIDYRGRIAVLNRYMCDKGAWSYLRLLPAIPSGYFNFNALYFVIRLFNMSSSVADACTICFVFSFHSLIKLLSFCFCFVLLL